MTTDKKKLKRNMTVFELLTVPGHVSATVSRIRIEFAWGKWC